MNVPTRSSRQHQNFHFHRLTRPQIEMVGVPLTSRAMVTVAAFPLLLLTSAPQCSTAFVLRASTLLREGRSTTAASAPAARRPTAARLLSHSASRATESRGYGARLMMATEPTEEGVAEEAAAAAAADEPPVAEGDEQVAEAPAADGEGGETEVVEDGETEVVAEDEAKEEEEEEVDPMEEVKQQIKVRVCMTRTQSLPLHTPSFAHDMATATCHPLRCGGGGQSWSKNSTPAPPHP